MKDARETPPAPSCAEQSIDRDDSNKAVSVKKKWEPFRHIKRRHRSASSDAIPELKLLYPDLKAEQIDKPSATATQHQDCSTVTEYIEPGLESPENERSSLSDSENPQNQASHARWKGFFHKLKIIPAIPFNNIPPIKRKLTKKSIRGRTFDAELDCFKSSWKNFSLKELEGATYNFSQENLIGEGSFAEVYKGQLTSGKLVAVKRLNKGSSEEEMTMDFLSELGIICHVDHPNVAGLIGYGVEGGMHLVLQLSPNGSLASILYDARGKLTWAIRFKIAVGTAEGLSYLHEGCQRRIIHKDIKASNILLTEEFEPQISDFGLSKWLPDQWTHRTVSKVEGTFGYIPPEFFMHGIVDEKTDVYAFGVLLLELITGRQAVSSSQQNLVMWAKPLIKDNEIKQLVDPILGDAHDLDQLNRVITAAYFCVHQSPQIRPLMRQVVDILKGDLTCLALLKEQENIVLKRTNSEEIPNAEEYNSTEHLNDLNRQMELLFGDA